MSSAGADAKSACCRNCDSPCERLDRGTVHSRNHDHSIEHANEQSELEEEGFSGIHDHAGRSLTGRGHGDKREMGLAISEFAISEFSELAI